MADRTLAAPPLIPRALAREVRLNGTLTARSVTGEEFLAAFAVTQARSQLQCLLLLIRSAGVDPYCAVISA